MESRIEQAVERYQEGYTCSQAVFATYADLFDIPWEQALKLSAPFGGGVGGLRQLCGSVSGMTLIAGLYNGMTQPGDKAARKSNFDIVKHLAVRFEKEHGSIRCGQLLGLEPGLPEGYRKKPCAEYVRTCARLIEEHLLEK